MKDWRKIYNAKGLDLQRYNALYEHIRLLWDGDYIPVGLYGDEGACNPTIANREKAIRLCAMLYKELEPHEEDIIKDYSEEERANISCERWLFGAYGIINHYCTNVKYLIEPTTTKKVDASITLPEELNTDRARKYFAKAIECEFMVPTATGYKWVFGGNRGKVRLGYFVVRVFCPDNTEQLHEQAIDRLFGVNRIGSAITQFHTAKKPQKWIAVIDRLFDN